LLGIYSTLGLAGWLVGLFRHQRQLENAMFYSFLVLIVSILVIGLKFRPSGIEIGVALGVAAVYTMVFLRMSAPAERTHLIEYSLVAALIFQALTERAANSRRVPRPALLAIAITVFFGSLDEALQAILPNRVFDPIDLGFNALAALIAVLGSLALSRARQWSSKLRKKRKAEG
jgi:hypothetical protein